MDLDARGLRCPLPIVKLTKAFKPLAPGEELRMLADDPAFHADVQAWCRKTGNTLLNAEDQDGTVTVHILKEA